ncbi:DNA polymerase III subunit delta [Neptunomonas sp. XY-337]|uniref:DNA polymerase III subunit delta n=1 Tax=Neptunomonas sp. XY-337 TaxID=2561897 RepID=UPI0010AA6E84|nr:DNA polymerase III subunit delta [Neptunomonas sp. XY-337]
MKLSAEQLGAELKRGIAPIYLVTGDEPLIIEESCDLIRQALRAKGFEEREVLHVDGQFSWEYLLECANALSLFASQKLIEIRLGSQKVNKKASEIIQEYAAHAPEDNVLLIIADKQDANTKKSAWYKLIEKSGVLLEVWPVEINQLPGWIRHRAASQQLSLDDGAIQLLCDRVEGNLLAAKQELEKLALLHPQSTLTADDIIATVSDSSRYDVYGLMDAIALGQSERCIKIINVLHQEGTEPPIILWALSKEIRSLYAIKQGLERGQSYDMLCKKERIWGKKKAVMKRCADRLSTQTLHQLITSCHELDRIIKGISQGSPWLLLNDISVRLCGGPIKLPMPH